MDVNDLLLAAVKQNAWFFVFLAFVLFLTAFFKTRWFKGKAGEVLTKTLLSRLDKASYRLINDVTLQTNDGTTQIDHVVVSRFGIFIVETKNFKGWIFCSPKRKTWTQTLNGKKYQFQNPLFQNYKHLHAIKDVLQVDMSKLRSLILFSAVAKLKGDVPDNVTYMGYCNDYIKQFDQPILTDEEVNRYIAIIENMRLKPGLATDFSHVKELKERHGK